MLQRILTGAVLTVIIIALAILSNTVAFPIIMSLISLIAAFEMVSCFGLRGNLFASIPAYAASVISAVCAYYFGYGACLAVTMCFLVTELAFCVFFDSKLKITDAFTVFASTLYIILCFSALTALRKTPEIGIYLFILLFIAAWMTDTFAYFTGMFLGKHKLIPRISPKKTVEGAIGGVLGCILCFAIYGLVLHFGIGVNVNFVVLMIGAPLMSALAQVGDLIASAIKRSRGIKDYSNLFPGHGGVLDRFDSIMILSPFLLFAAENLRIFG